MKITSSQLKQLIRETIKESISEDYIPLKSNPEYPSWAKPEFTSDTTPPITYKRIGMSLKSNLPVYEPFYKGVSLDKGGMPFRSLESLQDYMKMRIVSLQTQQKLG